MFGSSLVGSVGGALKKAGALTKATAATPPATKPSSVAGKLQTAAAARPPKRAGVTRRVMGRR